MKKKIFLLGIATISISHAFCQTWTGTSTASDVNVGTLTAPTDAPKLFVTNSENVGSSGLSPVTLRLNRNISGGFPDPGHLSGNLMEAITHDATVNIPVGVTTKGFVLTSNFNVGIGTSNPIDRLTVNGNIGFEMSNAYRKILGRTDQGGLDIHSATDGANGTAIRLFGKNSPDMPGGVQFISNGTAPANQSFSFLTYDNASNWLSRMMIKGDGRVGIGTDNPLSRLDVHNGDIYLTNSNPQANRNVIGDAHKSVFSIRGSASAVDPYIEMGGSASNVHQGEMNFINSDLPSSKFEFIKSNGTNWISQMLIRNDGKVVIGNVPVPTGGYDYKLYVKNGILTERVKVALSNDPNNWSDFVFDDDYRLMPLSEVEEYINENKHLPEIPSTKEVLRDGLDLAATDAKLLQKVEELTLYVIQQQKEIEQQRKLIDKLIKNN